MTAPATEPGSGTGASAPRRRRAGARLELTAVVVVVTLAILFVAGLVGYGLAGRSSHPGENSAEAGFARDMQTHHAQAVQMALTIRDKTTDPTLRAVAYDIATSQQHQAGQMYAWLIQWGLPQTSTAEPMAWMASGGHDMAGGTTTGAQIGEADPGTAAAEPVMSGMASAADLQRLDDASGVEAERLFLQLMISHHRGGVQMAKAVLQRSTRPEVVTLATAIEASQSSEIEQLTRLLADRNR